MDGSSEKITNLEDIQRKLVLYFGSFFKAREGVDIDKQLECIQAYPQMFLADDDVSIGGPITFEEVSFVLKSFTKDKFLGQNG